MSSIEPRLNPSRGPEPANGNGNGSSGNGNGNGNGKGAPVLVGAGVEDALAMVQQQLAREAATIRVAPMPVAIPLQPLPTVPRPVAPPPPPPPEPPKPKPQRAPRPRVVAVPVDFDEDAAFWGDVPAKQQRYKLDPGRLTREDKRALGKLRARKVRRIVRHVSPWSVFKVSLLFYVCMWMALMVAGVILWRVGQDTGVVNNIEKFYAKAAGEKVFEIDGRKVFKAAASAGGIFVFAATGFTVLLAFLFNLITDLTGGVRISVLELESARRDLRRGAAGERVKQQAKDDAALAETTDDAADPDADAGDD